MKYRTVVLPLWIFLLFLVGGCSTTQPHAQRSSYADLREMEKNNEDLMSGLDEYLKELDDMRVLSMSFPLRDRNAVNRKVEELHRRRLNDVRELSDKIKDYENHLAEEKEFYESLK